MSYGYVLLSWLLLLLPRLLTTVLATIRVVRIVKTITNLGFAALSNPGFGAVVPDPPVLVGLKPCSRAAE